MDGRRIVYFHFILKRQGKGGKKCTNNCINDCINDCINVRACIKIIYKFNFVLVRTYNNNPMFLPEFCGVLNGLNTGGDAKYIPF